MKLTPLSIEGAWLAEHARFPDDRGLFMEWLRQEPIEAMAGTTFPVAQANLSVSRLGTVRGIHFSIATPGQGKYVTCVAGAVRDVIVDVRVGSPTYGQSAEIHLNDSNRDCLLLAPGIGHAFQCLSESATVVYLCSTVYDPETEKAVNPLDPALSLDWGPTDSLVISDKDRDAPTLADAALRDELPQYSAGLGFSPE